MTPRQRFQEALKAAKPLTVGAIADPLALHTHPSGCDLVELRLDSLGTGEDVISFAKNCDLPLLITARGQAEGGQADWQAPERQNAYFQLLDFASAIDLELRDFNDFTKLLSEAKQREIAVVGSYHNFTQTPTVAELSQSIHELADIHKFALMTNSPKCIERHLELIELFSGRPLSVMGMGPLGAASRPLMAKAGSVLNYGFLGSTPTAPNQWPASLLQQALNI